ncbi:hypothetical protein, partial [Stenotrophomonas sp. SrG]|uniref:hypothetical protein n=1 Tax=Stenotrophomonas sp. SrG TaxID=3414430 RepID=UPI003CF8D267
RQSGLLGPQLGLSGRHGFVGDQRRWCFVPTRSEDALAPPLPAVDEHAVAPGDMTSSRPFCPEHGADPGVLAGSRD